MFILCVKSSHAMGMGHLFRMINLYGVLRQSGAEVVVVLLGEHPPSSEWLGRKGISFEVVTDHLAGTPGWETSLVLRHKTKVWVNDRLETDANHAARIKELGLLLVTFDDLGSGAAHADLHVAALAGVRGESPHGVKVLMGLDYLILAPEIVQYRRHRSSCSSMVVNFGGSDTHGMTVKVARWLSVRQQAATLILGPGFIHEAELAEIDLNKLIVKRSVPSLAAEFSQHDVAITGGGITAFEAAAAGLPSVTVANESFEVGHCRHLHALGCSVFAGPHDKVDWSLMETSLNISAMSQAALDAVNAEGAKRVCNELMNLLN
jgi:spore coat polysaccharide biosynthesis predicted glycosyltransferase SpsG